MSNNSAVGTAGRAVSEQGDVLSAVTAVTHFCPEECNDRSRLGTDLTAPTSTAPKRRTLNGVIWRVSFANIGSVVAGWFGKLFGKTPPGGVATPVGSWRVHNAAYWLPVSDLYVLKTGRPTSHPGWIRALLPDHLQPTAGNFGANIYFVNGIAKNWAEAHGQSLYIESFLGPDYTVRLIHNKTTTIVGDARELRNDYEWSGGRFGSLCTQAIFSLLHHGFDRDADIGLIGSSGGSLKTRIAVEAFASRGAAQRDYLRNRVQLVHLGCLVHRQHYGWLETSLRHYRKHVDRRDPFARTFSGELIPPKAQNPVDHQGPVLPYWIMKTLDLPTVSVTMGLAAGLVLNQGRYHAIRNNYMAMPTRHCDPATVFADVAPTTQPIVERVRVRFKTGLNGTTDAIGVTVAGVTFDAVDPVDHKLNSQAINWFYQPTTPIPLSNVTSITLHKKGSDNWRLKGLRVEVDTDQGLMVLYDNPTVDHLFKNNATRTFTF